MFTSSKQSVLEAVSHRSKTHLLNKRCQFALDLMVLVAAFTLAYLLRFDFNVPAFEINRASRQIVYVVLIQFAALILTGVYNFIWRYVGLTEVKKFLNASLWSALPLVILRVCLPENLYAWRVPFSVIVIDTLFGFAGILGLRVLRREMYERTHRKTTRIKNDNKTPVLLFGAGRAGVLTAMEIAGRGDMDLEVKGFIDDDPSKVGSVIHGVKVLGTSSDLPRLVRERKIDHVVITIAQTSRQEFRRILDVCESVPVKARTIPGLYEILQGRVKVSRIRDVQIEDLLGREPVNLDEAGTRSFLTGKTVMVTGAGGSIGSELSRQVARFQPANLLLVERAEFALFNIERELTGLWPQLPIQALVADVGDEMRMRSIFANYLPDIILHAAAHKHVPMMETNTCEAVKNNVLATRLLGELAGEYGVEGFVLISTDKAVRPTSVMGATKRVSELVVQGLDQRYKTRYVAVRFGNVIGSAGSVIPIFREQIYKGGPVTVTHPDMVRYFMTIPEAAQLVLEAGAMGAGGEIFILDMGEPVRILDLAEETIRLSGLKPHEDIDIIFTGIRPGEKLFEELEMWGEDLTKTQHPKIFIGKISPCPQEKVTQALERLTVVSRSGWEGELRCVLSDLLPEARLESTTNNPHYAAPVFSAELAAMEA